MVWVDIQDPKGKEAEDWDYPLGPIVIRDIREQGDKFIVLYEEIINHGID